MVQLNSSYSVVQFMSQITVQAVVQGGGGAIGANVPPVQKLYRSLSRQYFSHQIAKQN